MSILTGVDVDGMVQPSMDVDTRGGAMTETAAQVREEVRARYAAAAQAVSAGGAASCCGPAADVLEIDESFGAGRYDAATTEGLPEDAVLASLGCGNPIAV